MNTDIGRHVPTSAFRASLESEIVRELRSAEAAFAPPSTRRSWRTRLRHVALVALGLFIGVGAQLASAQVQESRQRSELESVKQAEREMVMLRLQMAKLNEERAQRAFQVGAASAQALREAESEVRQVQVRAALLELELEEIRATAAAPRDELWAPVTTGRDFVRERIQMQAMVAQQRLGAAEAAAKEAERAYRASAIVYGALKDAQLDASRLKMEFQLLATKLQLRDRFVKERLTAEYVTRELQRAELTFGIEDAQARLEAAKERVASARERFAVGAATEIDLKRAELETLQVQLELQRMVERYRALPPKGADRE